MSASRICLVAAAAVLGLNACAARRPMPIPSSPVTTASPVRATPQPSALPAAPLRLDLKNKYRVYRNAAGRVVVEKSK
jgi:hypothetical protein